MCRPHFVEISSRTTRQQDKTLKKAENLLLNVRSTEIILLTGAHQLGVEQRSIPSSGSIASRY
jgi:hypothetical protein